MQVINCAKVNNKIPSQLHVTPVNYLYPYTSNPTSAGHQPSDNSLFVIPIYELQTIKIKVERIFLFLSNSILHHLTTFPPIPQIPQVLGISQVTIVFLLCQFINCRQSK